MRLPWNVLLPEAQAKQLPPLDQAGSGPLGR